LERPEFKTELKGGAANWWCSKSRASATSCSRFPKRSDNLREGLPKQKNNGGRVYLVRGLTGWWGDNVREADKGEKNALTCSRRKRSEKYHKNKPATRSPPPQGRNKG